MMSTSRLLGSALLLAAGVWQLTPFKTACLRHCRSPVSFLSAHWRPGAMGAFKMGIEHGAFCLGCCWLLMALLFYGGVMNLIWIIGLAVLVLAEKVIPAGPRVRKINRPAARHLGSLARSYTLSSGDHQTKRLQHSIR
jgi:predicted metal-binding membrane protein